MTPESVWYKIIIDYFLFLFKYCKRRYNNYLYKGDIVLKTDKKNTGAVSAEDEIDGIIEMTSEDGRLEAFELLDIIEYEGGRYAVLTPAADEDDAESDKPDEIEIFREKPSDEDDDYMLYEQLEDDAVKQAVFGIFRDKYAEDFDFE